MTPRWRQTDLDAELVFDRYIGTDDTLDRLQAILPELAPDWSDALYVWKGAEPHSPIDIRSPGTLKSAVGTRASERGATYKAMRELYGPGDERTFGSAELRGSTAEIQVVVSVDAHIASPLGRKIQLGNTIMVQATRATVSGLPEARWMEQAFERLCDELRPAWGAARHVGEYWTKVMSDGPRIEAVGRDFARYLPGLFWLNFFGERYVLLMGKERLTSVQAQRVSSVDGGVLLEVSRDPLAWTTVEYAQDAQRVLAQVGEHYFFSKGSPRERTEAPLWPSISR
jgi:hypothetical protein